MTFQVLDKIPKTTYPNTVYLELDSWDDWFEFNTQYYLYYYDNDNAQHYIGQVKIGQHNMTNKRRAELPKTFEALNDNFFSLGQDDSYYSNLNKLPDTIKLQLLENLKDMAFNLNIFHKAVEERVTRISLLRNVTKTTILGQFNRLANGHARLTEFNFEFIAPKFKASTTPNMVLSFNVIPESNPPSNIHVIIGRNGVGKTHLLNNMLDSLLSDESIKKYGIFESKDEHLFANVVFVTFSAFDEAEPMKEEKDKLKGIHYSYIGLKRLGDGKTSSRPKSPTLLKNEFVKSLENCSKGVKKDRWINSVEILQSDPMFRESEIIDVINKNPDDLKLSAGETFKKLSSGHKIVLLTITRLVETIEERSLVLIDEPEAHLHPPLLSAFTRSLSNLLMQRNGVAIIATHSPVVLQEVPKNCTWKLSRVKTSSKVERPESETFGENVGILTQEVFGLEVTESGFYDFINKTINKNSDYDSIKSHFNNQLGMEARAIIRSLLATKK